MDLSHNFFSGSIPHCLHNISFRNLATNEYIFRFQSTMNRIWGFPYYGNKSIQYSWFHHQVFYDLQDKVEFIAKNRLNSFKGNILNYMLALDLSCNNLTGNISRELGFLSWIHALNLSHNQLTCSIPITFSNLNKIENWNLSHNNFIGKIPSKLNKLYFLGAFSVAYNNLSGKIPDSLGHGTTFAKSSF